MHSSSSLRRFAAGAALVILASTLLALVGCPKQEDFPASLDLVVPPTPTDFDITNTGTAYSFAWTLADPTNVDHYRIWVLGGGILPDEIFVDNTVDNPYLWDKGVSLEGLQFAVSAVSTQGVEGERAVDTAP